MKMVMLAQKKILFIAISMCLVLMLIWLLVYVPTKNRIRLLKKEFAGVENQIQQIEAMIGEGRSINEGMILLDEKERQLSLKFPPQEEEGLEMLSDLARQADVGIITIKAQPKQPFLNELNQPVEVDGKRCQKVAVTIEMKSHYYNLVSYIELLRESLPLFISFDRIEISKSLSEQQELSVTLKINLYLLS